jgi:autotransporter-like protein
MPTKAPPPAASSGTPHDWLAWVTVRGFDFFRGTSGNDLKGTQVDAFAGLTRRITPNLVVGVLGGYEHFDYSSQAFNGVLKGEGWTAGAFLGWKLSSNIRFDAGAAWSDLLANGVSGTASGNFLGTRWLVNGGFTGTYSWQKFVLEPSARVFALWEHDNAFTDSLGTAQPAHNFETGRASAGMKAVYPLAWTTSVVALSPYAGLYADYYFSRDDAQTAGLTTVPLLQGFSARATGGVTASFAGGATLGAGGEFGGIGSANHIWTWTARGRVPF